MADLNEKDMESVSPEAEDAKAKESKAEKSAKDKKKKKPNFFKRIGRFFRDCFYEMKKVTWLSGKETFKSSLIVIVVTVVLSALIGILDTGLEAGIIGLRELGGILNLR